MPGPEEEREIDRALAARAVDGDFDAFESLVRKYQARTYAVALGMMKNAAEAEEVVQDTFLTAFEKLSSFRGESAFSSWLYRVTMNHCLMRLRKKRPSTPGDDDFLDDQAAARGLALSGDAPRSPDTAVDDHRLRDAIDTALAELPDDMRAVLLLRAFEGLSNQEVAELLGDTVSAVKSRLHRARLLVRERIAPLL
jgi:RNA polymerase sigma-70 factor (ECF subfamily)